MRPYSRRTNKYGRQKTAVDGHIFDSKLEAAVYLALKNNPDISEIWLQNKIYLTDAKILAKIDFKVMFKNGTVEWVEAKGKALPTWNIKKRLWKHYGPGPLQVWKGTYTRVYQDEYIVPGGNDAKLANGKTKKAKKTNSKGK